MVRLSVFMLSFLLVLVCIPLVMGSKGEITLLTVGETSSGKKLGGTADISLEIKPGSGKVFIDSFPYTREDTQVSVRFAKDVACNFLEIDCSKIDFFYSIDIGSYSVGGPSAGAGVAVLTVSVLTKDELDEFTAITGTINSGGIIGPVSGLEEKVVAAKNLGFKKVLVPKNSVLVNKTFSKFNDFVNESLINESDESNLTVYYADSLVVEGVEVIPVSTLEEALYEFTGKVYPDHSYNISVSEQYQEIMGEVAEKLCNRSKDILRNIPRSIKEEYEFSLNNTLESLARGFNATSSNDYYSAASFCFTANSNLRFLEFKALNDSELELIKEDIRSDVLSFLDEINNYDLRTMSELETYIIVKERLLEAYDLLDELEDDYEGLGYIKERFYSGKAWSSFFDFKGEEIILDEKHLANACISKISEAGERLSYIDFLSRTRVDRSELEEAERFYEEEDYAFCIFRATKIKADANAIILTMSLTKERVTELIEDQLVFARMQINKQKEFPILGYSYYNYANSLKDSRPELSIVFAEYASEFSNLDMYFPSDRKVPLFIYFDYFKESILGFIVGFALCVGLISLLTMINRSKKKNIIERRTRRTRKGKTKIRLK